MGLDLPTSHLARVYLVIVTLVFCVQVFVAVDRQSHSVSDTLYGIFPYIAPASILLYWIASKASGGARP